MTRKKHKIESYKLLVRAVPLGGSSAGFTFETPTPSRKDITDVFGRGNDNYIGLAEMALQIAYEAVRQSDYRETVYVGAELIRGNNV